MVKAGRPRLYTIPVHRGFADALAAGLLARVSDDPLALARTTVLLPNRRAARAVNEAFVRLSDGGLLMPRLVVIGDIALDEESAALLDPLGQDDPLPPAVDPLHRQLELARIFAELKGDDRAAPGAREAVQQAALIGRVIDQLAIARLTPDALKADGLVGELSDHWQTALALYLTITERWKDHLDKTGRIDRADRQNRLLDAASARWRARPPKARVVAAGITSAAPAITRLLHVIARLPDGMVVLPGLDTGMDAEAWEAIGPVSRVDSDGISPEERDVLPRAAVTHPQYHLKLLLDRLDVARDEVLMWPRAGESSAGTDRGRLTRSIFLPAEISDRWGSLEAADRRLGKVQSLVARTAQEEAQAIAIAIREGLETPGKRIALITPDRALAARVVAHLKRWGITADDSAGRPLADTGPGGFLIGLAHCVAHRFAPVPLLALLKHPLCDPDDSRVGWLDRVRDLDRLLRRPSPAPGLAALGALVRETKDTPDTLKTWWNAQAERFGPLEELGHDNLVLSEALRALAAHCDMLSRGAVWAGPAGRMLGQWLDRVTADPSAAGLKLTLAELPAILFQLMQDANVRPAFGAHPRIAIYGLLEARLQQADLVICAGLREGSWPQAPDPDPYLAPAIRRRLGLPSSELAIGMAAHDFATALGAPELILTRAERDTDGPAIASRFWLRLEAVAELELRTSSDQHDQSALALARAIDRQLPQQRIARPAPAPPARMRQNASLSATDLDRLRADPFAFYAGKILHLRTLDAVAAEPSAAWRGTQVHDVLEAWKREDGLDPQKLIPRTEAFLAEANLSPPVRLMWRSRLLPAMQWVADHSCTLAENGRVIEEAESWGEATIAGTRISGKADRIDRMPDGTLAIVDYKTGTPPSAAQSVAGYALQLGLLGLIAEQGTFKREDKSLFSGECTAFEYWALNKQAGKDGFGYVETPVKIAGKRSGFELGTIVEETEIFLRDALARWISGSEPFTAKLNPDYAGYTDYDQLMRLEEWYGRLPVSPSENDR